MSSIKQVIRRFSAEESGATMVEYGIMVALIAAVAIVVIDQIGTKVTTAFQTVNNTM